MEKDNRELLIEYIGKIDLSDKTTKITTEASNNITNITNNKKHNKNEIYLEGKIQAADQMNHNGRIYPKHILMREYNKMLNKIQNNKGFGELDHPNSSIVNLNNVSHMMTEIWWVGNDLYGKLKLIDTRSGNDAKAIVDAGGVLGISSRGLGSTIKENNADIVQENFEMITWDLVCSPSTKEANVFPSKNESKEKEELKKNIYENLNSIIDSIILN